MTLENHAMNKLREMDNIAKNWKKLNGLDHWKDALNPPSPELRQYIIHCGEMAKTTYDGYIHSPLSKNAGNCMYKRKNLLSKTGHLKGRPLNQYDVTKYMYATSAIALPGAFVTSTNPHAWSKKSNWIGFVAVANEEGKKLLGRRDIMIAWRGTVNPSDWLYDVEKLWVSAPIIFGPDHKDNPKVHAGWYSVYTTSDVNTRYNKTSARDQALEEVKKLVHKYRFEEISLTITGHSMGASIAQLNAVDIVVNGLNQQTDIPPKACPVTAIRFASPRVGNSGFKKVFHSSKDLYSLRINNRPDVVPRYPVAYADVGVELTVDTLKSPYLQQPGNQNTWHNMEAYLHAVAGVQSGIAGGFKLVINRDLTLVNKFADILDTKYGVPTYWWVQKNKGMVQNKDGFWELKDHEEIDRDHDHDHDNDNDNDNVSMHNE